MTFHTLAATTCRLSFAAMCWFSLTGLQAHAQAPAESPPPVIEAPSGTGQTMEVTLAPRPVIAMAGSAEWEEGLATVMGTFDKLRAEMAKAGLQPGGRPIAVFTETDDKGFRFDAMIPLTAEPTSAPAVGEGFRLTTSPAGRTMKFEHRGSYDDVDSTYEAITAYLDEKGLEAQNLFIEEYLNTPKGSDDQNLELDIYVFLR
jgi:effector-binding domain-containing protein